MTETENLILTVRACLGNAFPVRLEMARQVEEAIERARVVGVLDAWRQLVPYTRVMSYDVGDRSALSLQRPLKQSRVWVAESSDAARASAAKAIEAGEV